MARVATYLRRSSSGLESADYGIPIQRAKLAEWMAANGHEHVGEYSETGADSWQVEERKELSRLLADARRGLFDVAAVWREDRLSKDSVDCGYILHQLRKQAKVRFISLLEPDISDDEATNDVMRDLRMFGYRKERETLKIKIAAGLRMRAERGRLLPAGTPLYGYLWHDERDADGKTHRKAHFVPDETSIDGNPQHAPAAVVRRLYSEMQAGGVTIRELARRLTDEHVPTPAQVLDQRGMRPRKMPLSAIWRPSTVARLLSRPAYCGHHAAYRTERTPVTISDGRTGKAARRNRVVSRSTAGDVVAYDERTCPPLVSLADWNAVQSRLSLNKAEASRNHGNPHLTLLRDFSVCGYCGRRMGSLNHKTGYRYYCGSRGNRATRPCPGGGFSWQAAEVDALAWAWVEQQLRHPELARQRLEQRRQHDAAAQARQQARIADLEHLLAEAEQDAAGYDTAMVRAASARDAAHYQAMASRARDTAGELRKRLDAAVLVLLDLTYVATALDMRMRFLSDEFLNGGPPQTFSYDEKRQWLRDLGVQVTLRRKHSGPDALVFSIAPVGAVDDATADDAVVSHTILGAGR